MRGAWQSVRRASQYVKEEPEALNLLPFAKTSGSRGLHVFVPIRTGPDADEVLAFAQSLVSRVAAGHPRELTVEHSIAARGQRVYLRSVPQRFRADRCSSLFGSPPPPRAGIDAAPLEGSDTFP